MKIVLSVVAIVVLMIGCFTFGKTSAPNVHATSDYQAGYNHGVSDAKASCTDRCHWYILEPGKGFGFHTQEFNDGYVAAMCAAGIGSDADEATWSCPS